MVSVYNSRCQLHGEFNFMSGARFRYNVIWGNVCIYFHHDMWNHGDGIEWC